MKPLIYILLGIFIGLIQMVAKIEIFNIPITLMSVSVLALPFLISGNKRLGTVLFLSGAIALDIFSPYRPGLYLLSAVVVLGLIDVIMSRSFELDNPLIAWFILFLSLTIFSFFELAIDLLPIVFLINIVINSVLAIIVQIVFSRLNFTNSNPIKVSEDVHFR